MAGQVIHTPLLATTEVASHETDSATVQPNTDVSDGQPHDGKQKPSSASTRAEPREKATSKRQAIAQMYARPLPVRTVLPLPPYYPGNTLSVLHVVCTWLRRTLFPSAATEGATSDGLIMVDGVWSPATRSVHVVDERAMRVLWEHGFFGKGHLSRSEPNWSKKMQLVRDQQAGNRETVAELRTEERRRERVVKKWERARLELEAIERTKKAEAEAEAARKRAKMEENGSRDGRDGFVAPVGPLELLALPNSLVDYESRRRLDSEGKTGEGRLLAGLGIDGVDRKDLGHLSGETEHHTRINGSHKSPNGAGPGNGEVRGSKTNGILVHSNGTKTPPRGGLSRTDTGSSDGIKPLKGQKSVRFSPKVDSTTFQLSDPPSPNYSLNNLTKAAEGAGENGQAESSSHRKQPERVPPTETKEHLQLAPEEAFFLAFAIGCLRVFEPVFEPADSATAPVPSANRIPTSKLLTIFRRYSYFPTASESELAPDDPFLVRYAVYHHLRSLGWVVRTGLKFGVDWLLYLRGPVFSHAEFGVLVMPTYTDERWRRPEFVEEGHQPAAVKRAGGVERSWHWLHGINRLLAHVLKTLVLVHVDVPPPDVFRRAMARGFKEALASYRISEVVLKRWSTNRSRGGG